MEQVWNIKIVLERISRSHVGVSWCAKSIYGTPFTSYLPNYDLRERIAPQLLHSKYIISNPF